MAEASQGLQRIVAALALALILVAWWWMARGLPDYVLPGPVSALSAAARFFYEPGLMWHAGVSLARVAAAVLLAMAISIALAGLVRKAPILEETVERRLLTLLSSFPSVGWAILGVIWFQISNATVIFIQVAIVLPFCLINALAGFRQIDPELDELGRSLTRQPLRRFFLLTLPLITPFMLAGLRIAYGIGWKIALVSELFGARSGLGYLLMQAQRVADASMVFGCCLIIVVIYAATDWFLLRPLVRRYATNPEA